MSSETQLISFVVRFVTDAVSSAATDEAARPSEWHGVIRHVQSDAECHFTRWEEAGAFVARYLNLDREEKP